MPSPDPPSLLNTAWIELPDKGTHLLTGDCRIGRVEGNEIVNPDSRISRRHAVIQREGGRHVLVDLGSTNGTFLNGQRIFKPARLKDGDVIVFGVEPYVFCQPHESNVPDEVPGDSKVGLTAVVVGKAACWMLWAAAADTAGTDWLDEIRPALTAAGGAIKIGPGINVFTHWRDRTTARQRVRALALELGRQTRPPRACLVLHYGAVRVGQSATPGEENLLGAEVTFTHKLLTAAPDLGVSYLLSEEAVQSLDLAAVARPLGTHALSGLPGSHALFTVEGAPV